ncbi:AI-2E family transporter, partial [Patescibacteria group bacterium]|nr:AI-2E family transporter [Patescibacteria group bacterium]
MKTKHIIVDAKAVLVLIFIGAAFFIALKVLPLIFALFISTILTMGMLPAVDYLENKKIPRGFSVITVYGTILTISIILISIAFIPMVQQTIQFANNFPKYLNSLSQLEILKPVSKDLNQKIIEQSSTIVGTALEKTIDAVSGVFLIFTVLVL